ncbi:MAG: septum formation initiator family protein [Butyrivibrio sp.]|nr:septum formation initiator family protein [Muribaculum sp.]MCM1551064.1 septum formation initiator family protein [Butyrivibrio sp.]
MEKVKRKKVAYRKRNQNRLSMVLVALVVTLITVAVAMRSMELTQRLEELTQTEQGLEQQKAAAEQRAQEIDEFRKYTQTKRYVEEVAKDKLGLMYEGEVLFKEED